MNNAIMFKYSGTIATIIKDNPEMWKQHAIIYNNSNDGIILYVFRDMSRIQLYL